MEKKEQSYELQTFTYYVHLSVFQLSCIFFAQSLNKHYFLLFNYEICGFFKKKQTNEGGFPSVWGTPDSYSIVGREVIKYQVSIIWQD